MSEKISLDSSESCHKNKNTNYFLCSELKNKNLWQIIRTKIRR